MEANRGAKLDGQISRYDTRLLQVHALNIMSGVPTNCHGFSCTEELWFPRIVLSSVSHSASFERHIEVA